MKRRHTQILFAALACLLCSTCFGQAQDLNSLSWLIGKWEIVGSKAETYEIWERVDSTLFKGKGVIVDQGQIRLTEELLLYATHLGVFYIPTVKHNGRPVPFRLDEAESDTFVFRNAQHDSPKAITYVRKTHDNLEVIVGDPDQEDTFTLKLMRVKR